MSELFPSGLLQDAEALLADLQRLSLRIATAESCTGGLLIGLFTEIPGVSATVERGYVTYSNDAKAEMLGVPDRLINECGAVSDEVVRAMAEGALRDAPVEVAVAVTGIAGPDGGTPEKPVGLVYIAATRKGAPTRSREHRFGAIGRREVRLASVREAIALTRSIVSTS